MNVPEILAVADELARIGWPHMAARLRAAVPPMDKAEGVWEKAAGLNLATPTCVCGEPQTLGTVHRTDGPCYQAEPRDEREEPVAWANVERNGRLHTYHGIKELPVGRHHLYLRPAGPSPEAVAVAGELERWSKRGDCDWSKLAPILAARLLKG